MKMNDINPIKPGSSIRYYCDFCLTEYEIQLEPKAEKSGTAEEMESKAPLACPFCGEKHRFEECL